MDIHQFFLHCLLLDATVVVGVASASVMVNVGDAVVVVLLLMSCVIFNTAGKAKKKKQRRHEEEEKQQLHAPGPELVQGGGHGNAQEGINDRGIMLESQTDASSLR